MPTFDPAAPRLTPRIAAEIAAHEGIVREAYRDAVGVWTWGLGITDASGHRVARYRDNPQTLSHCLEIFCWALERKYMPAVLSAFAGYPLRESEFAAAISFHWNTGAIARAEWVKLVREGQREAARRAIMNWSRPASLIPRRRREQVLFFDGKWSSDGTALIHDVAKPGYQPTGGRRIPVIAELTAILAEPPQPETDATIEPEVPEAPADNWFKRLFGVA